MGTGIGIPEEWERWRHSPGTQEPVGPPPTRPRRYSLESEAGPRTSAELAEQRAKTRQPRPADARAFKAPWWAWPARPSPARPTGGSRNPLSRPACSGRAAGRRASECGGTKGRIPPLPAASRPQASSHGSQALVRPRGLPAAGSPGGGAARGMAPPRAWLLRGSSPGPAGPVRGSPPPSASPRARRRTHTCWADSSFWVSVAFLVLSRNFSSRRNK